jgi:recombination protein RecT
MTKAIQKQEGMNVLQFLTKKQDEFSKVIPKHMDSERMMRLALSAINTTPHLAECTIQSVAVSLMACSALGLEPNTPLGHAYLIPFNQKVKRDGRWTKEYRCNLIVGYKGYIELFYRSGAVSSAMAYPVFDCDEFDWTYGLNPTLNHKPSRDSDRYLPQRLTHVYPVIRLKNGDPIWEVFDRGQIETHRARSMAKDSGPWVTDYIAMALKTGIRAINKWVPFSVDKVAAANQAEALIETGNAHGAIASLGPSAYDVGERLLEGVPEDEEPTPEPAKSIDDVTNSNLQKAVESKRSELYDLAGEQWGENKMIELAAMCRSRTVDGEPSPFSVTDADSEQIEWAMREITDRAAAKKNG